MFQECFCIGNDYRQKGRQESRFCVEIKLLYFTEIFCRGILKCVTNSGVSKNILLKRDKSQFSNEICISQSTEKLCKGPLCVLESQWYRKTLWLKKGEGVSRFSFGIVLSHLTELFRRGTLKCATNFGRRKYLCLGGLLRYSVEIVLSHSAEKTCR